MVAPVIMAFGSPEQQKRFLPGIASGEVWWSQGYSEPGSGSDLASLKTRAERHGDKLHRQRPEDLDHARPVRRMDLLPGAHQHRRQAADRHQLPADRHEVARRHRAPDRHARRRARGQRGLLRQRRGAGREPDRRREQGLDLRQAPARARAHQHRRRQPRQARARAPQAHRQAPRACTTTSASATRSRCSRSTSWRSRCWCCACCRPRRAARRALDIAGLLKIKGSEIQQRYSELMMLAARPLRAALSCARRWKPAGRATGSRGRRTARRWPAPTSTCARPRSTAAATRCSGTSSAQTVLG